jgi:hypothetical protein
MRVRTHLISMPWAVPETPSIQIACLKAHLDKQLPSSDGCISYSAFFSILHDFKGRAHNRFFDDVLYYKEYIYLLLYLRRYGPPEFRPKPATLNILKSLRTPFAKPLTLPLLNGLEQATRRFLDGQVAPKLLNQGLNLVGFTLNYSQVYSSLYAAEYLRRRFSRRCFLFVFGGYSASLPTTYKLLTELSVPGVVVAGEGEKKLEFLVRTVRELPFSEVSQVSDAVADIDPGIIMIGGKANLGAHDPVRYATQLDTLNDLALPDYTEYFRALRQACADGPAYHAFRENTAVSMEGSRGCFVKCDFCSMNRTWHGFRKRSAERIMSDALALTRRYHTCRINFVDGMCNSWAEEYARRMVQQDIQQHSFMALRAHPSERYWTLLSLAGVTTAVIGIEALSAPLLKAIGKGTSVVQNLATQKYLTELGIKSGNVLITHHPVSTLADINETRRILGQISHWDRFWDVRFQLEAGSPLFEALSKEEQSRLKPGRSFRLPPGVDRFALELHYCVPKCLSPGREVSRAWTDFGREYRRDLERQKVRRPRLEVLRIAPDTLRITDTRHGKSLEYDFTGAEARVYDACHGGLKFDQIVQATGLPFETVRSAVGQFLKLRLLLQVDDHHLSLATRPRDELVRRFFAAQ